MATARSFKVNRTELLDALRSRQTELERTRDDELAAGLKNAIDRNDNEIERTEAALKDQKLLAKELRAVKTVDELEKLVGWRWSKTSNTQNLEYLRKQIRLLEMGTEDSITVGPTSDLAQYL